MICQRCRAAANYFNPVRLTDQERIDNFNDFLKNGPGGKIDFRTIRVGWNKAIDVGVCTFTF